MKQNEVVCSVRTLEVSYDIFKEPNGKVFLYNLKTKEYEPVIETVLLVTHIGHWNILINNIQMGVNPSFKEVINLIQILNK